jgi:hypothetical protein
MSFLDPLKKLLQKKTTAASAQSSADGQEEDAGRFFGD